MWIFSWFTNLISFIDLQFNVRKWPLSLLKVKNPMEPSVDPKSMEEQRKKSPNSIWYFIHSIHSVLSGCLIRIKRQQNLMKLSVCVSVCVCFLWSWFTASKLAACWCSFLWCFLFFSLANVDLSSFCDRAFSLWTYASDSLSIVRLKNLSSWNW